MRQHLCGAEHEDARKAVNAEAGTTAAVLPARREAEGTVPREVGRELTAVDAAVAGRRIHGGTDEAVPGSIGRSTGP